MIVGVILRDPPTRKTFHSPNYMQFRQKPRAGTNAGPG